MIICGHIKTDTIDKIKALCLNFASFLFIASALKISIITADSTPSDKNIVVLLTANILASTIAIKNNIMIGKL